LIDADAAKPAGGGGNSIEHRLFQNVWLHFAVGGESGRVDDRERLFVLTTMKFAVGPGQGGYHADVHRHPDRPVARHLVGSLARSELTSLWQNFLPVMRARTTRTGC
jgi:hypothetical protein